MKPIALHRSRKQVRLYVIETAQTMLALSRNISVTGAREGLVGEVRLKLSLKNRGESNWYS